MYLKEISVPIPFHMGKIVIRKEKTVQMELSREYSSETQDSRVVRKTIGQVVPLFEDQMYPNENYFALVKNDVPKEIRDPFLLRCAKKRERAQLKKDPAAMQRRVSDGVEYLKEKGKKMAAGGKGTKEGPGEKREWYIRDLHDLSYAMQVFNDLYGLMEVWSEKHPDSIIAGYKVKMFNRILEELKGTLPDHRIVQSLELIEEPRMEKDEDGVFAIVYKRKNGGYGMISATDTED